MNTPILASHAAQILQQDAPRVIQAINSFTFNTFKTRGGRLGSGMGSLLEAMWVYYMNQTLQNEQGIVRDCELAWLQDHEPADFACLYRNAHWNPSTREGELFRIEAKSMNIGVDEAKGHFTNLRNETQAHDQLLVLIWSWVSTDNQYFWPQIHDYFLGNSLSVIEIRDALHLARGGSFVMGSRCPDECIISDCTHDGEPLNAAGKRERRSGPRTCRPPNVDYSANFGGLVRMLKTDGENARKVFRNFRCLNEVHRYISFIHTHFPNEEINHYLKSEWHALLRYLNISATNPTPAEAQSILRTQVPNYKEYLRDLFNPSRP